MVDTSTSWTGFSDLQIITVVLDKKKKKDLICLHYAIKHLLATIISTSHQISLLGSLSIQGCELFNMYSSQQLFHLMKYLIFH